MWTKRVIIKFMEKLKQLLDSYINNGEVVIKATASNPRDREKISKLKVRPVSDKKGLYYQAESFAGSKVFHKNLKPDELAGFLTDIVQADFRQLELETDCHSVTALISKKGSVSVKAKNKDIQERQKLFTHNKQKRYILPQDEPVPFLVELGVQTPDGKIVNQKYDKFRQINRYLEFVRDILPSLPKKENEPIRIIDFGCGKSYFCTLLLSESDEQI